MGGYVRDYLLNKESKDIDIEIYGVSSFSKLEKILIEFGAVNSVGKSFGVCKLKAFDLDLDFSFPRTDSKIFSGHKGFEVTIDSSLDYAKAASRRDFTINAIGYDVQNKQILDPYLGIDDLNNKILRAVDISKFAQDPLRVLRAVQFSARFDLTLNEELFVLCKTMVQNNALHELPKERIFEEIKKLLLKSTTVSNGVKLLKELGTFEYFSELNKLNETQFANTLESLDKMRSLLSANVQTDVALMLAILIYRLNMRDCDNFLKKLTNEKKLIASVLGILKAKESFSLDGYTQYELHILATKVNIERFVLFLQATTQSKRTLSNIDKLKSKAKTLNILNAQAEAILGGKDVLSLGLEPSKEFSSILKKAYRAQISGSFDNYTDAIKWLKKELFT